MKSTAEHHRAIRSDACEGCQEFKAKNPTRSDGPARTLALNFPFPECVPFPFKFKLYSAPFI